jgi:hypothetical protein
MIYVIEIRNAVGDQAIRDYERGNAVQAIMAARTDIADYPDYFVYSVGIKGSGTRHTLDEWVIL